MDSHNSPPRKHRSSPSGVHTKNTSPPQEPAENQANEQAPEVKADQKIFTWPRYFFCLLALTAFFEITHLDLFPFLNKMETHIIQLTVGIILSLWEKRSSPFKYQKSSDPIKTFESFVKALFHTYLKKGSLAFFFAIILSLVYLPPSIAKAQPIAKICVVMENLADEYKASFGQESTVEISSIYSLPSEPQEKEHSSSLPLENRLIIVSERTDALSTADLEEILFFSGDWAISEDRWDDPEYIFTHLFDYVNTSWKNGASPYWEETAISPNDLNRIAYASELENQIQTSDDLEKVIEARCSLYSKHALYDLLILLRENWAQYGNAYLAQGLSSTTARYFYGQSICLGLQALDYQVDYPTLSFNLEILSERYNKLAATFDKDNEYYFCAIQLGEVFHKLSQAYCS